MHDCAKRASSEAAAKRFYFVVIMKYCQVKPDSSKNTNYEVINFCVEFCVCDLVIHYFIFSDFYCRINVSDWNFSASIY